MMANESTAATHLQADDLRLILERLESGNERISSGQIMAGKQDLATAKGLARAAQLAADKALEDAKLASDRAYYEALTANCDAVLRLTKNALAKIDQGRASVSQSQIDGAIGIAERLVEDAERYSEVVP